jgi:diguanylate cyclase (GGDEF)-like protein
MAEDRSNSTAPHAAANDLDGLLIQQGPKRSFLSYVFFQASPETTHEQAQAFARVVIVGLIALMFLVRGLTSGDYYYFEVAAAYLAVSVAHVLVVRHWPDRFLWRRYLSILADLGMAGFTVHEMGITGLGFYPLFLWIVVGNGLRFGIHHLQVATVVGLLALFVPTYLTGIALAHPGVVIGLLAGLLLMPKFFMVMIKRLAEANQALKEEKDRAEFMAHHDTLTGLPNRAMLEDHMALALAKAQRNGTLAAIVFIDLDSFKAINDNFGHHFGDLLLKEVANCLKAHVRGGDTVARLGGDEFIVLIEGLVDAAEIAGVIERVFGCVGRYYRIGEYQTYVTWSGGVALYPQDGRDAQTLIKHADTAMYRAKAAGANQFRLYDAAMSEDVASQLSLRDELRHAIEEEQFLVHYQPLVEATSQRITAVEALVRWQHPTRGLVAPGEFIEVAEQTGLIVPIGQWVLQQACRDVSALWQEGLGGLTVHVNVSARQLAQADFAESTLDVLERCGLPPQALAIEVTESALIEDAGVAKTLFQSLKRAGVAISLDDFGTGYSSLAYLKRFDVDHIKIDRSFVVGVPTDADDCALVDAIIAIGDRLGCLVIAEGVETVSQMDWLAAHGCLVMQGYYFGAPMGADALAARLREPRPQPAPLRAYAGR